MTTESKLANYSNPTATTCNLSVALHMIRELLKLPLNTGDECVRKLAASFDAHDTACDKVALPLVEYRNENGRTVASAPLLQKWDPNDYQDASECLMVLLECIEKGLAGTPHEGLVRNLVEGKQQKQSTRHCNICKPEASLNPEAFRSLALGGQNLSTDVAALLQASFADRKIDNGDQTVRCNVCDAFVAGSESYTLMQAPEILILTLSRSSSEGGALTGRIDINEELQIGGGGYDLISLFVRRGNHYYAYLRSSSGGMWKVDDMGSTWAEQVTVDDWKRHLAALTGATDEQATTLVYRRRKEVSPVENSAASNSATPVENRNTTACTEASQLQICAEEAMGSPVGSWPNHYSKAATVAQLGYSKEKHDSGVGRHGFVTFCVHNGLPPDKLVEWLSDRNCIRADSWSEISSTLRKLEHRQNCGKTWDLHKRESVCAQIPVACASDSFIRAFELLTKLSAGASGKSGVAALPGCKAFYSSGGGFPAKEVCELLHREGSPLQLREVCINSRGSLRGRPLLSVANLAEHITRTSNATSLHIGPAFTPDSQVARTNGALPLGTEMVLEIDDLPDGISEAMRWEWLRGSVSVVLTILRDWFGVKHVFHFASGNRGPHIWVLDDWVLSQTREQRVLFFKQLQDPTSDHRWPEVVKGQLFPLHTLLFGASETRRLAASDGSPSPAELIRRTYPMFDEAVATNPTHLHRLPFSVNDKTGRVAIPFGSVSEMPTCLEDMPLASDPHLRSKLQPAYQVLQNALQSLQGDTPQQFVPGLNDRIPPVTNAPWMNAARQTRTQGADRQACRVAAAPLQIDIEAAVEWQQKLELGAQAGSLGELSENVRSIARAAESKGKDWRARLRFEAGKVSTLVDAVRTKGGLLDGETHTKGFCRTQTYYPQLDSSQFFQMLSSQTKYEVIAGEYIHFDLKSAHLALSWSAVQLKHGGRAKEVCPNLHLAATNGEEARNKVIQFYANHLVTKRICSPKEAKVKILAAWNDARSDFGFCET